MNTLKPVNQAQSNIKKVGRKVKLALSDLSPDERLDTLADIIIERIFEESKNGKLPILLDNNLQP